MLAYRATPRPNISSAQNKSTGQKPCRTKNSANVSENRQVAAKKILAPETESEQFGASVMRCSMARRIAYQEALRDRRGPYFGRRGRNFRLCASEETLTVCRG